jgi:hypothetical protein
MEICLPAMAMPSYGCGSSDWSSMGQMVYCPSTLDQGQTAGLRKRGWGDAAGSEDGRLVRQRAEGAGISVGVSTEGVYAWHGYAPGHVSELIRYHGLSTSSYGLSTSSYGLLGQGAVDQHQQTLHNQHPSQHQQPIQPLQFLQTAVEQGPQLPQRNAFHVLMTAAPMKIEGIVCSRCYSRKNTNSIPLALILMRTSPHIEIQLNSNSKLEILVASLSRRLFTCMSPFHALPRAQLLNTGGTAYRPMLSLRASRLRPMSKTVCSLLGPLLFSLLYRQVI